MVDLPKRQNGVSHICMALLRCSLVQLFYHPIAGSVRKLALWIPQTRETGVLKFGIQQELQSSSPHARQELFIHVDFSPLNIMFPRLLKIVAGIVTSCVSLGDVS